MFSHYGYNIKHHFYLGLVDCSYAVMLVCVCQNTLQFGLMSSKKQQVQAAERAKAQREAHLKEAAEYKQRIRPLVQFLRAKKLRFNHAQVANERVEYFRIDEFEKIVEGNKNHIEADPQLTELVKGAMSEFIFFRRPDHIKVKYPKALEPVLPNHADRKFACFRFDTTESRHWMAIMAIVIVLALVLFPIWPFEVKYAIWLVSLVLLVAIVGLLVVRLAVYLLVVVFDYHVWIFPNFLNSTGFWDSFIPVIEVAKGDKSWFNVFVRLFAFGALAFLALHVYFNPTFIDGMHCPILEQVAFTRETIQDVHDWGVGKLQNKGNFSQRALTNLEEILNQTADAHQQETEDIPEASFEYEQTAFEEQRKGEYEDLGQEEVSQDGQQF